MNIETITTYITQSVELVGAITLLVIALINSYYRLQKTIKERDKAELSYMVARAVYQSRMVSPSNITQNDIDAKDKKTTNDSRNLLLSGLVVYDKNIDILRRKLKLNMNDLADLTNYVISDMDVNNIVKE